MQFYSNILLYIQLYIYIKISQYFNIALPIIAICTISLWHLHTLYIIITYNNTIEERYCTIPLQLYSILVPTMTVSSKKKGANNKKSYDLNKVNILSQRKNKYAQDEHNMWIALLFTSCVVLCLIYNTGNDHVVNW